MNVNCHNYNYNYNDLYSSRPETTRLDATTYNGGNSCTIYLSIYPSTNYILEWEFTLKHLPVQAPKAKKWGKSK